MKKKEIENLLKIDYDMSVIKGKAKSRTIKRERDIR